MIARASPLNRTVIRLKSMMLDDMPCDCPFSRLVKLPISTPSIILLKIGAWILSSLRLRRDLQSKVLLVGIATIYVPMVVNAQKIDTYPPVITPNMNRVWWDTTGKFSVFAKMQSHTARSIVLLTSDGRTIPIPKAKLSVADRIWVASITRQSATDAVVGAIKPASDYNGDRKCPVWGYDHISDFPKNFQGHVLFTQGSMVCGVENFAWFNSPVSEAEKIDAVLSAAATGVVSIPSGEPVTLEQRAAHPRSGKWVFRVRWRSKSLWVLADSLGKDRESFHNSIHNTLTQKETQHPVLTDGKQDDVKFAFSIYDEPILGFSSSTRLVSHFKSGWIYPRNMSESERMGAITLSPNTKLRIIEKLNPSAGLQHYLVEPLDGHAAGKKLYLHPDDICDERQ